MAEEVTANKTAFSFLFNSRERLYLINEDYQRDYSWEPFHVTTFLENYAETLGTDSTHYLGTIFAYSGDEYQEIVDGQHRVITGILLLLTLYPLVSDYFKRKIEDMVLYNGEVRVKPYRVHQRDELNTIGNAVVANQEFSEATTKLGQAFLHLQRVLDEYVDSEQYEELVEIILDSDVVKVTFSSEDDAIRAFQIQNSGGKTLTILDRLRSLLVEKDEANRDNIGNAIEALESAGLSSNGRDEFRKYVTHYLDSEPIRIPQIKKFVEYTLAKHGDTKFTETMKERSEVYRGYVRGENPFDNNSVDVFRKLQYSTTFTKGDKINGRKTIDQSNYLLLEAVSGEDFSTLSRQVFFFWLYLSELSSKRMYNSVFKRTFYQNAATRFKQLSASRRKEFKLLDRNGKLTSHTTLGFIPRDEWLEREYKYKGVRDRTLALYVLENFLSQDTHQNFLTTWSTSTSGYHLEHILPRKHYPDLVNNIGNLVILKGSTNSKLQDSMYEDKKREEYLKHGLKLCTKVAEEYTTFNVESVVERELSLDNLMYDILYHELVG